MIYLQLFFSFLQVGLFSVGGGYAAIPLIQNQAVAVHGWMTMEEFSNLVAIAEMTPGPISLNAATFVGTRQGGMLGAAAATFGCVAPSFIIVSLMAYWYQKYKKSHLLNSILDSLRPAVVGLIASAGLGMTQTVLKREEGTVSWLSAILFFGAFLILRRWKCNPILILCLCGALGLGLSLGFGG